MILRAGTKGPIVMLISKITLLVQKDETTKKIDVHNAISSWYHYLSK